MNRQAPTHERTPSTDLPEVDQRPPEPIDPAHRRSVEAGLADMRAGRIATKAEIDEAFARFGRTSR